MASRPGSLHLGTQGFAYDDWVGPFYPPGTSKSAYLEAYAQAFSTVEIDSTFYATPRGSVVDGWARRTPDGFRFAAKFPKLITHDKSSMERAAMPRPSSARCRRWARSSAC